VLTDGRYGLLREVAAVERLGALRREPVECAGEVGHADAVARDERALGAEDRPGAVGRPQDRVEERVQRGLLGRDDDSGERVLAGGRDELGPGQAPVHAVGLREPRDRARNGDGGRPDPVRDQVVAVERDVDDGHGRRGEAGRKPSPGDCDEEIERAVGAVAGAVDEHEPAAAGPGERALGHPRDEAGRDAGVDRVAALRERACACLDGQRMAGGDGALHGDERTAPSRAGQEPPASSRGAADVAQAPTLGGGNPRTRATR
jgi:hypothetical protein